MILDFIYRLFPEAHDENNKNDINTIPKVVSGFLIVNVAIAVLVAGLIVYQNSNYDGVKYDMAVTLTDGHGEKHMMVAAPLYQIYPQLNEWQRGNVTTDSLFSIDTGTGTILPDRSQLGDCNYLLGERVNATIVVRNVDSRELNTARVTFDAYRVENNQSLAHYEKIFTDLQLAQYEDYTYNLNFTIPQQSYLRGKYHVVVNACDERGMPICTADEYVSIL
ncbi:hypothetical protein [Methanocella sp. MCL-LM]|uniref:hypothetical protein n=1 Tax=Methanocella sp. MCL-LM TaxID=3412035 RepID=UPI003C71F7B7